MGILFNYLKKKKMSTSVIVMGLVMVALFVVPVILLVRAGRKNKDKNEPTN